VLATNNVPKFTDKNEGGVPGAEVPRWRPGGAPWGQQPGAAVPGRELQGGLVCSPKVGPGNMV